MVDQEQGQTGADGVEWRGGVIPVSRAFDDPYFSLAGGFDETAHVFLAGNDLPARLRPGFQVAELGFGTGLNLLALAGVANCPTRFTSFEAFPLTAPDIARALSAFAMIGPSGAEFVAHWAAGKRAFQLGPVAVEVIIGDARETLPQWPGRADAWFLDGFAPAKNPELWGTDLLAQVAHHTAPGGTFATYTAAGHVRRSLQDAGFSVARAAGFGTKRHMSRGILA
jgi:tRNA U34 5-methylaminomethyl-2-thiouridine-forming methyltransferase MnmC